MDKSNGWTPQGLRFRFVDQGRGASGVLCLRARISGLPGFVEVYGLVRVWGP